ncbi:MAG: PadR family transcriptional regulator [Acetanaerobacterium sp.]
MENRDVFDSLMLELRRGTLVLSVLCLLDGAKYGYVLVQTLGGKGITVDAGTLYPLLRRLEGQGLLQSEWETTGSKPRKYYKRTEFGTQVYTRLRQSFRELNASMEMLFEEGEGNDESGTES